MFTKENMMFKDWLIDEMNNRKWSQADLAKKSGVARATISNLLNEVRNPGTDLIIAIANALDYPAEYVMRRAGILPIKSEQSEQKEELLFLFDKLPEKEKEDLLKYTRIKLMMAEEEAKKA
ncbi:MAG: helix-turn-helix transcriptional regulator [Bacillota bacterium]